MYELNGSGYRVVTPFKNCSLFLYDDKVLKNISVQTFSSKTKLLYFKFHCLIL